MKLTILSVIAFPLAVVSAQNITVSETPTPSSTSDCAVQSVFDLCISNQEVYIKKCQKTEFACLCSSNKQKMSCWNNCPNNPGLDIQQGVVQNACSMPGANVSVTPWSSSMTPTSTQTIISSSVVASSTTIVTPTKAASDSSTVNIGKPAFALVCVAMAYMLF